MQLPDVWDLSAKVAMITSASPGMGRDVALCLARYGAGVTLAARHAEHLEASARLVREVGGQADVAVTDVTQADPVEAMGQQIIA